MSTVRRQVLAHLLREPEAAAILGLTARGLQRKRLAGEIEFVKLSYKAIRYELAALQRYIDRHRVAESEVA